MSIYATYWEIAVPVWVQASAVTPESGHSGVDQDGREVHERFIKIHVQAVPAHIGHEAGEDYYSTFLPPLVEYKGDDADHIWTPRAVFIIDEDHTEKDGQRYVQPLMMLTGEEYEATTFAELLRRIKEALEGRFGVGAQVIEMHS